jgi:hypothetical protein
MDIVSTVLALSVIAVICVGHASRKNKDGRSKGIGWQFIRYIVIGIGIPITGILALNDSLTGEAATLIAGAMGYAFGKSEENGKPKDKSSRTEGTNVS